MTCSMMQPRGSNMTWGKGAAPVKRTYSALWMPTLVRISTKSTHAMLRLSGARAVGLPALAAHTCDLLLADEDMAGQVETIKRALPA